MKDKNARMLPGDFQKSLKKKKDKKYGKLKDTKKQLRKPEGFFTFPEDLKGNQEVGERPFLVFYFDSKKQYDLVRKHLEVHGTAARSHPDLDSNKLYRIVKKVTKKRSG